MFYENFVSVCEEHGVYPTQVLKECGCATGVLGGWKKGAWPNSEIVIKLAAHLNVSTDRLLFGFDTEKTTDEIKGISVDGLRTGMLWEQLDEPGRAIVLGDIYKRLEGRTSKPDAEAEIGGRAGKVG